MLHELSEHSLAGIHPSLSAIAIRGGCGRFVSGSPEKVQIEKSKTRPSQLIPRRLLTDEKF